MERRMIRFAVALSIGAGATDAMAIIRLGTVFASVMTGNLVLLGVSLSRRDAAMAIHAGAAVGGYVVGVAAGAVVIGAVRKRAGEPGEGAGSRWPHRARTALGLELALLLLLAVGWEASGGRPALGLTYALVPAAAAAMGVQSAVARSAPGVELATTYMTGTLTEVVSGLVAATARSGAGATGGATGLLQLCGLVVGACAGALLVIEVPRAAPVVALVAVVVSMVLVSRAPAAHGSGSGPADGG